MPSIGQHGSLKIGYNGHPSLDSLWFLEPRTRNPQRCPFGQPAFVAVILSAQEQRIRLHEPLRSSPLLTYLYPLFCPIELPSQLFFSLTGLSYHKQHLIEPPPPLFKMEHNSQEFWSPPSSYSSNPHMYEFPPDLSSSSSINASPVSNHHIQGLCNCLLIQFRPCLSSRYSHHPCTPHPSAQYPMI